MNPSVLSCRNLSVTRQGSKKILTDVSASFTAGSLTAVIGKNGAGKTTLLRALCGLEEHYKGEILIGSQNIKQISRHEFSKKIAWLPQQNHLPFPFTCLETVVLGRYPWHLGRPQKKDYDRALSALAQVKMADFAERSVSSLSSGERQRTLLARVLASDSEITILDEPCATLDLNAAIELLEYLRKLTEHGQTICLSIHDVGFAKRYASHVLALKHGFLKVHGDNATDLNEGLVKDVLGINVRMIKMVEGHETFCLV